MKDTCYYPKHGKGQKDKKIEGYSSLTLKTYCFQYNLLLRFFGDIDMNRI